MDGPLGNPTFRAYPCDMKAEDCCSGLHVQEAYTHTGADPRVVRSNLLSSYIASTNAFLYTSSLIINMSDGYQVSKNDGKCHKIKICPTFFPRLRFCCFFWKHRGKK